MLHKYLKLYKLVFLLLICDCALAQTLPDTLLKIKDAVQLAQQHYHLLQASRYEAEASQKNISLAKYSRKPTIDISYQANLGTANNLTGIFYPSGILPMTGPPSV